MIIVVIIIIKISKMLIIRVALRRVPSMLRQDSRVKLRRHSLVASPRFALSDDDDQDEQRVKYWDVPCPAKRAKWSQKKPIYLLGANI